MSRCLHNVTMAAIVVDIEQAEAIGLLSDPTVLGVWELTRRFSRPASVDELATLSHVEPASVQRMLDQLAAAGLLEKLPIRSDRRVPTYRSRHESIVIAYDPSNPTHLRHSKNFSDNVIEAGRRSIARFYAADERGPNAEPMNWRHRSYCLGKLQTHHVAELQRLVRGIHDYMTSIQAEIKDIDAGSAQDCNFQIMIEAVPAAAPALPMPHLLLTSRERAQDVAARAASTAMHALSPRERQVGLMLASGKTRPEIAEALGVSLNTVATIGKRIYAKLGVKRRAELATRLRAS